MPNTFARQVRYIIAATMACAAMALASPASAGGWDPHQYGPKPDWAQFKELGEAAIRDKLIDPDSAKFQWPSGYEIGAYKPFMGKYVYGYFTCGYVNSRNRMGGYVGRTPFVIVEDFGTVLLADMGALVGQFCDKTTFPPVPAASAGPDSPIGVDFITTAGGAFVNSVAPGGPGDKAGLKLGMIVTKINGIAVKGMSVDLLRQLLAGVEGTANLEMSSGDLIKVTKP